MSGSSPEFLKTGAAENNFQQVGKQEEGIYCTFWREQEPANKNIARIPSNPLVL